ncbi:Hpt domain protein [compost metagenome]
MDPLDPDEAAFNAAVQRLIPGYLAKRANDLAALRDAYRQADLSAAKDIGHRLAGSGSSYGFETLTLIGRDLEGSAERGDHAAIARLITELDTALIDARNARALPLP